jgi:hypothetical protein
MTDGDGRWIAYNGEVYDIQALRQELSRTIRRTSGHFVNMRSVLGRALTLCDSADYAAESG